MRQGSIPRHFTRGIMKLLHKNKHGGDGISNFRPITMINTDLKILAKILASCLQTVLPSLICPKQTCAVKGRTIQDSLHLVCMIVEKVDENAALINLDQSKAFDRVDHSFLESVLSAAGFGLHFHTWIKANPVLRSLTLPGSSEVAKYTAYTDDVSVLVTSSAEVEEVSKEIRRYEAVAGAKINREKSIVLWLGSWKGCALSGPFIWKYGLCKILGVWFRPDFQLVLWRSLLITPSFIAQSCCLCASFLKVTWFAS